MKVTIISADINSGKTTYVNNLVMANRSKYLGFISFSNSEKNFYYLEDIKTKSKIPLMDEIYEKDCKRIGKFFIKKDAFLMAKTLLLKQVDEYSDPIVVLDEIGRLELNGEGFDSLLKELIDLKINMMLCVRKKFVSEVIQKYRFDKDDLNIVEVQYRK